jgi:NADPH-dependent curcumin reductase CurA
MRGSTIGIIKASKSDAFSVGSFAVGYIGWRELAVVKATQLQPANVPANGKLTDLLGVLGKQPQFQRLFRMRLDRLLD